MQRKKLIRSLKYVVIALVLLTIVLFILSAYALFTGIMGAISGFGGSNGESPLSINTNNPNGDWTLTFSANPKNTSPLGERLTLGIGILDSSSKYIAVNSTAVDMGVGEQKPFSLTLTVPSELVQKYDLSINGTQATGVVFELKFGISTLANLVSFSQTMRIPSGGAGNP